MRNTRLRDLIGSAPTGTLADMVGTDRPRPACQPGTAPLYATDHWHGDNGECHPYACPCGPCEARERMTETVDAPEWQEELFTRLREDGDLFGTANRPILASEWEER